MLIKNQFWGHKDSTMKTKTIISPDTVSDDDALKISIFIAGGISNCPDWQQYVCKKIAEKKDYLILFNPRRSQWDDERKDSNVSYDQIVWEYNSIEKSTGIIFWFPKDTLCPITLFELGAALNHKDVFAIGVEPGYQREFDIRTQVALVNPEIKISNSLDDLIRDTVNYVDELEGNLGY